jgi:hypothetical protein
MKSLILSLVLLLRQKSDPARVWRGVGAYEGATSDDDRAVSRAQIEAIKKALKTDKQVMGCRDSGEPVDSVLEKLTFERLQLSSNRETVLVEDGPGCLRGAQGANGSMWIAQLNRGRITVLASPAEDFEGWIYSVQATANKGYHDIVLGWHLSAVESGLGFFRFDGTRYRQLSLATLRRDDDGKETIAPR